MTGFEPAWCPRPKRDGLPISPHPYSCRKEGIEPSLETSSGATIYTIFRQSAPPRNWTESYGFSDHRADPPTPEKHYSNSFPLYLFTSSINRISSLEEWRMLWQLRHSKTHLSNSSFMTAQDLLETFPIVKDLFFRWWKSNADWWPEKLQSTHFPPRYSMAAALLRYLRIFVLQELQRVLFLFCNCLICLSHTEHFISVF